MADKIFVISGKVSNHWSGESSEYPRAFKCLDSAEDAALDRFIEWLDSEDVVSDDDVVVLAELEQEGTFDETTVQEMATDGDGNIPLDSLRDYVSKNHLHNLFASTGTETYIDLDVNEVEIED